MPDSEATLLALAALSSGMAAEQPLDETLDTIIAAARQLLSCSAAGVWVYRRAQKDLVLTSSHAMSFKTLASWGLNDSSVVSLAATQRETVMIDDRQPHGGAFANVGLRSGVAVPLMWQGDLHGVLVVADTSAQRVFSPAEVLITDLLARNAANAIASAELKRRAEQLEEALVTEQDRLLHTQVALRQMLEEPDPRANLVEVTEALRALGWRRVALALFDSEGAISELITQGVPEDERASYSREIVPVPIWERLVRGELKGQRGSGVIFVASADPASSDWKADDLLFAPLRVGQGALTGMVRVEDPVDGLRPTPEALRPLDILVSQAAYIAENARLLSDSEKTAEALAARAEELSMLHQADRELSAHLNVEPIMQLTTDCALRRTGADTALVLLMTEDNQGLVPALSVGYVDRRAFPYDQEHPLPLDQGVIGRAARSGETQFVQNVADDADYIAYLPNASSCLAVPIITRGEVLGVMALASTQRSEFSAHDISFLEQLGGRAAVAMDNARLFRQADQLADDMTMLYNASRIITSTLERDEMLQRIAQAMTMVLECSSAVIFDYYEETEEAHVLTAYRSGTVHDSPENLPEVSHVIRLDNYPAFRTVAEQRRPLALRAADPGLSPADRQHLERDRVRALLIVPLLAQEEIVGLAAVIEGRRDRQFPANEVFKAETLASQASVAMRQAALFGEVRELEKLKSEMIRMASHDLRNPLNNIIGYVELIGMALDPAGSRAEDVLDYLNQVRKSSQVMKQLLEDLLTLERIESERQSEWRRFDLGGLILEVVEGQKSDADLKDQTLDFARTPGAPPVLGSQTQLRQAITNLIGNGIKYTPEGGRIEVSFEFDQAQLRFQVRDNGYGISPERQVRLFERFYRAREPGTDHIGGTGLGLSLVKTVIERHGGEVWVESAPGAGSSFGFWLPAATE